MNQDQLNWLSNALRLYSDAWQLFTELETFRIFGDTHYGRTYEDRTWDDMFNMLNGG